VAISGNKVLLTLATPAKNADIVTISYTKPANNPLQTIAGAIAADISTAEVTNNCKTENGRTNDPPVVIVNAPKTTYSGFISEIDATSTYDPNYDPLKVEWNLPSDVPVSDVNSFKTQFLAPVGDYPREIGIKLKVNDGDTLLSNEININVQPYKPELGAVRIIRISASDFKTPDYPENIVDGSTITKWSSDGNNKWILLKFAGPFIISHIEVAFLPGQHYESYFDIYTSNDSLTWEPILTRVASCNFSGNRQIFNFPEINSNKEYSYLKYVGQGNSVNSLNSISEFKIFGTPGQNSRSGVSEKRKAIIYPNPATFFLNISIEDNTIKPDMLRIFDISGNKMMEKVLNPVIRNIHFPISLGSGVYSLSLVLGNKTFFTQKFLVKN
jgi:hypothetical protein